VGLSASVAYGEVSSGDSVTIDNPGGGAWASGSTLGLFLSLYGSNTEPTTPSGWQSVGFGHVSGGPPALAIYAQTLSENGPGSYTVFLPSSENCAASIIEYRSSLTGGWDSAVTPAFTTGGTSTAFSAVGVTAASANEILVCAVSLGSGSRTMSGWSSPVSEEAYQLGPAGEGSLYVADGMQSSAGATGNVIATLSGSAVGWIAATFGLLPASAGAGAGSIGAARAFGAGEAHLAGSGAAALGRTAVAGSGTARNAGTGGGIIRPVASVSATASAAGDGAGDVRRLAAQGSGTAANHGAGAGVPGALEAMGSGNGVALAFDPRGWIRGLPARAIVTARPARATSGGLAVRARLQ